ncbi:hypothetical protein [Rhizobium azibense]|uniref:Uncharacterized protein n=1 Tax=Rhizobium azibense TaxID=1136135 RepID=A0A4R3RKH5_9HYPH|nr:hypothetical protein [Rhizobium azibense]TCU34132.1 hypothetical protein EV129_113116 [Rhizobium azibense]
MNTNDIDKALEVVLRKLKEINSQQYSHSAAPHVDADEALKDFFVDIGRQDIADEYEKVEPKWYE